MTNPTAIGVDGDGRGPVMDLCRMYREGSLKVEAHGNQVACGACMIRGETREMIFLPPPSLIELAIPEGPVRLDFRAGVLEEAWGKPKAGACAFVVEVPGQCRFEQVIDPTAIPGHRRFVPASVHIPAGPGSGGRRVLRLTAEGMPVRDYRWAVWGEPRVVVLDEHLGDLLTGIQALARDPDNLQFSLYRELMYWANAYRSGTNRAILNRTDPVRCDGECRSFVSALSRRLGEELGRLPRVLDFGSGPFSTLRSLRDQGIAEVTAMDILGEEWGDYLEHLGIGYPVPVESGSGETLLDDLGGRRFDLVYVQNALDHTQVPMLSWLHLVRAAQPGGYVGQTHAVREASWEKFDQLHQYDLYPDETGALWIEGRDRKPLNLIEGLGLEVVEHGVFEATEGLKKGKEYCWSLYRRVGEADPSSVFLEGALRQFMASYGKRDRWARRVEDFLLRSVDGHVASLEGLYGLPYWVRT